MSFSAEALELYINNNQRLHDSVRGYVGLIRSAVDRAAKDLAASNAEWHDDPKAEDHAKYHAPADEQYPRAVRDRCIMLLVRHWLGEFTIQEGQ